MADEAVVTPGADVTQTTDTTATTEATQAAPTDGAQVAEPSELDTLLAGEIVDDAQPTDDPFASVKELPQFQELTAQAEGFKAVMEAAGAPDVENLKAQVSDAHTLYAVVDGKAPAGALLDQLSVYGADVQKRVALEAAAWLQEKGFIQNGNSAPEDPALAEVRAIKEQLATQKQQQEEAVFNKRVDGAKSLVHGEIGKFLESKGLKGYEDRFLRSIAPQFAGKEMQLVEAAEKGDFKAVSKALQQAYNGEVKYMQAWFKALKERKQTKQDGIPNIAGSGTTKGVVKKITERPASDDPKFLDWMVQQGQ